MCVCENVHGRTCRISFILFFFVSLSCCFESHYYLLLLVYFFITPQPTHSTHGPILDGRRGQCGIAVAPILGRLSGLVDSGGRLARYRPSHVHAPFAADPLGRHAPRQCPTLGVGDGGRFDGLD